MTKYLYVDESEDSEQFILCGLLVDSQYSINKNYKKFKRSIQNYPLKNKTKDLLFNEFKSTLLDKRYQKIKFKMLYSLQSIDYKVLYARYVKKNIMMQDQKEEIYINMLNKIINNINCNVNIVFDCFHKTDFEDKIINTISVLTNVNTIIPKESFDSPGIQYTDNVCSAIRRNLNGTNTDYFEIIKNKVIYIE